MKLVINTPDRLTIEDRPWFVAGFAWMMAAGCFYAAIIGASSASGSGRALVALMGLGLAVLSWYLFPFQTFTFDRRTDQFTRRITRPFRTLNHSRSLTALQRAKVSSHFDTVRMERLVLLTEDGVYHCETGFSSSPRGEIVETINTWLAASR